MMTSMPIFTPRVLLPSSTVHTPRSCCRWRARPCQRRFMTVAADNASHAHNTDGFSGTAKHLQYEVIWQIYALGIANGSLLTGSCMIAGAS